MIQIYFPDIMELTIDLDLETIIKNGKSHVYASKVNTNLKIEDYKYKFGESGKGLEQLHRIFSTIIDNNKNIIINTVTPVMEEKLSKLVIELFNNITQYNYEEFFPEKVSLRTLQ